MSWHTEEHVIDSRRGWRRPLYSYTRVYPSKSAVKGRVRLLEREWGEENVVSEPKKDEDCVEVVYIRVY